MTFELWLLRKSLGRKDENFSMAFRQLGLMMGAGVPTQEALDTIITETGDKSTKRILTALKDDLSTTASREKKDPAKNTAYDNQALVYILKQEGSRTNAAELLYSIADELEKRAKVKRQLLSAMIYPTITISIALMLLLVILTFVVPVFEQMYLDFGKDLPAPTLFVINISTLVQDHVGVIITAVLLIALFVVKQKKLILSLAAYLPVFGDPLKSISILQFTRYLSVMLKFDIPLSEAIFFAATAVDNIFFSNKTKQMGNTVSQTAQLKAAMEKTQLFPRPVLQAVAAGEKAGALDTVFAQVAKYYEKTSAFSINTMVSAIDIFIIVFLGGTIGGMVVAMYLPIFRMAGAISGG